MLHDWKNITEKENTSVYNIKGDFLFKIPIAPNRLYDDFGFYSNASFKSESVITIQSEDYRYDYDLEEKKFTNAIFTK